MYCDNRVLGSERWYSRPPADYMLRIPDVIKNSVCFLAVRDSGGYRFGGTGFFVLHSEDILGRNWETMYLVTANHCVEKARAFGKLYARLTLYTGETRTIELTGPWIQSEPSDLAIMPMDIDGKTDAYVG